MRRSGAGPFSIKNYTPGSKMWSGKSQKRFQLICLSQKKALPRNALPGVGHLRKLDFFWRSGETWDLYGEPLNLPLLYPKVHLCRTSSHTEGEPNDKCQMQE